MHDKILIIRLLLMYFIQIECLIILIYKLCDKDIDFLANKKLFLPFLRAYGKTIFMSDVWRVALKGGIFDARDW